MPRSELETPDLLADAFRLGAATGWSAAARGGAGEVFRLDTSSGVYAAKEFVAFRPDPDELERQIRFAAACRAVGVPNPETLSTVDGATLFAHPETGRPWLIQRWAEGLRQAHTDLATAIWLARKAATIHRLSVPGDPGEQINPFYTRVTADWAQTADTVRHAGLAPAQLLARRVPEFETLAALVNAAPIGEAVLCHRDLKATNTLLAADGARCLLDWDTSGPQEPWRDLGPLLLHHVDRHDVLTAIASAYRAAGGDPWPEGIELFASGLAVWLNYLHRQIVATLDPAMDANYRAAAAENAGWLVDRIPTIEVLEAAAPAAIPHRN